MLNLRYISGRIMHIVRRNLLLFYTLRVGERFGEISRAERVLE